MLFSEVSHLLRFLQISLWLLFAITFKAEAQSGSNIGKEFYTTFADHIYPADKTIPSTETPNKSYMVIYITAEQDVLGGIDFSDNTASFVPVFVGAHKTAAVVIPGSAFLGNLSGVAKNKAIHIKMDNNVSAYAEIYGSTTVGVTAATMLLPVTSLGSDYQSINFTQKVNAFASTEGNAYSYFDIVATVDNTQILITPSAPIYTDNTLTTTTTAPFTITLNKGDVYQALSLTDLTGSHIRSVAAAGSNCNPIAVYSGSTKNSVGSTVSTCNITPTADNLFQQVFPTSTWGNHFITVPLKSREASAPDIYRVILNDVNTTVNISPVPTYQQSDPSKGYLEFSSTQPLTITANKPIQAVQYALSQFIFSCSILSGDLGDAEMIYLTPLDQAVDHASFYSTARYAIDPARSYINVVIPSTAASSFKLDNTILPSNTFSVIPGNTNYSYARISVSSGSTSTTVANINNGSHYVKADKPFVATAYGFGNYESYGYPVGANFEKLNRSVVLLDPSTNSILQGSGCSGKGYTPQLTVPFPVTQITWKVDGTTVTVQQNLQATTAQSNDQTVYSYNYFNTVANSAVFNFITPGAHTVTATIKTPYSDCEEDVNLNFNLLYAPVPLFSYANTCAGDITSFTISTPNSAAIVSSYSWDFGDGNTITSTQNTITHKYVTAANYLVKVTANYTNACSIASGKQTVNITDKPLTNFSYSVADCTGAAIIFKDVLDAKGNVITGWAWDFGDGGTSTEQNPTHTYTTAKNYTVKLTITNNQGCQGDAAIQTVVVAVRQKPVANFSVPDGCLDKGIVQFKNTSDLKGEAKANFTYSWDFGEPSSLANTSTLSDPQHRYDKAGVYNVFLIITSVNGCISNITKQITVNTANPNADFMVSNANSLCSANAVVFQDKTTTYTSDAISKVVWHWGDGATETFTKNDIHTDGMYTHSYSFTATGPTSKIVPVTLEEYTGTACMNLVSQNITVNASPMITITQPNPLCLLDFPINIVTNKNGFDGKETFTGDGITAGNTFDPHKAGVGTHTINYMFTDIKTGCNYTQTFYIIVNPVPTIKLGPDITLLEGDAITFVATATGTNLKYKWSPSDGLDRDDILSPAAKPLNDTKYILTVTSDNGCANIASFNVTVLKSPKILNAFTPNGDGINDLWYIDLLKSYPAATVNIYSRTGEKVFSSVGYSVPWDGKFKGLDLPVGVYYYIVDLKNGRKSISGYVTIIR